MKNNCKSLLILSVLVLCSCSNNPPKDETKHNFMFVDSNILLEVGETYRPEFIYDASEEDDDTIEWFTENNEVATVEDGLITAVAVGETNIYGKLVFDGSYDNLVVTVYEIKDDDPELKLNISDSLTLKEGHTFQIVATIEPTKYTDNITYSIDDEDVATIRADGLVSAIKEGIANITVEAKNLNLSESIILNVIKDETNVDLWDNSQDDLRSGNRKIDFYNLNDTHGAVDEDDNNCYVGLRKLGTFLEQRKAENENGYVFTSSGDMWQGSADSNITRGALLDSWMEAMDCSAMALGNHEFDWGISRIIENDNNTNFPFLACNIVNDNSGEVVDWVQPYTTITRNGVHIGIIGAIGEGITSSILASNVVGLTFADPLPYVKQWSNYLKDNGADIILFIYHYSVAALSDEYSSYVDGIFGGHNHSYEKTNYNGVPAVEALSYGKAISHISITYNFDQSNVYNRSSYVYVNNLIYTNYGNCTKYDFVNLEESAAVNQVIASYSEEINVIKNEQIANLPNSISGDNLVSLMEQCIYEYYQEYYDGNLKIYAVRHNQSRKPLPSGVVTYGDIYASFPFDNALVLCKVKAEYAAYYRYTDYLPYGEDTSTCVDSSGYVYMLTIDYLSEHETYGRFLTTIKTYPSVYPRDMMKKELPNHYPLS